MPGLAATEAALAANNEAEKDLGGETTGILGKILSLLGSAIDVCCGFKDNVMKLLEGNLRRFRRLFIQGKVGRRYKWFSLDSLISTIGNAATSVANQAVNQVVNTVT